MLFASPGGIYGTLGICLAQLILVAVIGLVSYIWKHAKKSGNGQGAYAKKREAHRDGASSWNGHRIEVIKRSEDGLGSEQNITNVENERLHPRSLDTSVPSSKRSGVASSENPKRFGIFFYVCIPLIMLGIVCFLILLHPSVPEKDNGRSSVNNSEYQCENVETEESYNTNSGNYDDIEHGSLGEENAFEPITTVTNFFAQFPSMRGRNDERRLPRILGCRLGSLANKADYVERNYKVVKTRLLEKRIAVAKERDFHGLKGFSDVRFMADISSGRVNCIALLRLCGSLDDAERCFQLYMSQLEEIYDVRMREETPSVGSQIHRSAVRVFDDFEMHLVCSLVDFNQNPDPTVFISFTLR